MCEITCVTPNEVEQPEAARFKAMVEASGEVNSHTFPALYQQARSLCFVRVGGELAGVGALKRPYQAHRNGVFASAQASLPADLFTFELGWFHVLDAFKGRRLSSRMVSALMAHTDGTSVYATSRANNVAMHAALERHGDFIREGRDYPSQRTHTPLCLFVRLAPGF